jgi:hypothetical protein
MVESRSASRGNRRKGGHLENPGVNEGYCVVMDLREVGWRGMDWIYLARAVVIAVMNLRVL